jgi:hypothetical protein
MDAQHLAVVEQVRERHASQLRALAGLRATGAVRDDNVHVRGAALSGTVLR